MRLPPSCAWAALAGVLLSGCQREQEAAEEQSPPPSSLYPTLGATPFPADYPLPARNRLEVSKRVHAVIAAKGGHPADEAAMKPYDLTAPRAESASLKMLVIPGGEFVFGSDHEGEGPPRKVKIEPFWMAETEVTWGFYEAFYRNGFARNRDGTLFIPEVDYVEQRYEKKLRWSARRSGREDEVVDVIAQPTMQYHDIFLSTEFNLAPEYPAMNITHHGASKFCQWLSAQTGHFYRLPTEAEWEYACRAGTTTDFYFGDDIKMIDEYAWHGYNAEFAPRLPKQKKPNAWGLYDMHGNVAEWVLDGFDPKFRASLLNGVVNPWSIPLTRYPRIVKGGSWDHDQPELRVTARTLSSRDLIEGDPFIPPSLWYPSDAHHIGIRMVRPLKTPSAEEMHLFWNTDWMSPERNAEDLGLTLPSKK